MFSLDWVILLDLTWAYYTGIESILVGLGLKSVRRKKKAPTHCLHHDQSDLLGEITIIQLQTI